jgi:hypothetical protein
VSDVDALEALEFGEGSEVLDSGGDAGDPPEFWARREGCEVHDAGAVAVEGPEVWASPRERREVADLGVVAVEVLERVAPLEGVEAVDRGPAAFESSERLVGGPGDGFEVGDGAAGGG